MNIKKRHPIQLNSTLWELLQKATIKESKKRGKIITPAAYVRQIVEKHCK